MLSQPDPALALAQPLELPQEIPPVSCSFRSIASRGQHIHRRAEAQHFHCSFCVFLVRLRFRALPAYDFLLSVSRFSFLTFCPSHQRREVCERFEEERPLMKSVVVVGAQWGDEGKGKVVDYLAGSFDYIARVAG